MKACEGERLYLDLSYFTYELIGPQKNKYFISNLTPNNKPRNAQIFHYLSQEFLVPTP
jgi:hypothetical protein